MSSSSLLCIRSSSHSYGPGFERAVELADSFNQAFEETYEDVRTEAPDNVLKYFQLPPTWEEQRDARRAEQRAEREAVEAGLRSNRRRPRTCQIGDRFNVSCLIDGVRRSRSVTITPTGFEMHRGATQLYVSPERAQVTVTAGEDTIEWTEFRRAGEVISYRPNAIIHIPRSGRVVELPRWGQPRLVQNSNNIYHIGHWGNPLYVSLLQGDICYQRFTNWNDPVEKIRFWDVATQAWAGPAEDLTTQLDNLVTTTVCVSL